MRLDLYIEKEDNDKLLELVGIDKEKIPRNRGIGVWKNMLLIHTRTGGMFNRKDFKEGNDYLKSNPNHLVNMDDTYDLTYADWWFQIP